MTAARTPSSTLRRRLAWIGVVVVLAGVVGYGAWRLWPRRTPLQRRELLWNEIQPVALENCTFRRFGSVHDGGYLMCENLLSETQAAYSYGIDTEDNWGCQLSQRLGIAVHQYDCFTEHRPTCPNGTFIFHDECIGPRAETIKSELFDSLENQIAKNGDSGKRLLVKMDIEGAEWESLLATPDDVFERIDQLPMELHGTHRTRFIELVRKLKRHFHLVSVHFNNHACSADARPFPAAAYQVLFVNKRLGVLAPGKPGRVAGSPPDAPDDPARPDCQSTAQR